MIVLKEIPTEMVEMVRRYDIRSDYGAKNINILAVYFNKDRAISRYGVERFLLRSSFTTYAYRTYQM